MTLLRWNIDKPTNDLALKQDLIKRYRNPAPQANGFKFNDRTWQKRLRAKDRFQIGCDISSPDNIISSFTKKEYLQGLALVVIWGRMSRTSQYVYGNRDIEVIRKALVRCSESIRKTDKIDYSWQILSEDLNWSKVIISKTLHFLCRALGYINNPPVPIDGKVICKKVWPEFKSKGSTDVKGWNGDSFDYYSRYMTVITTWAETHNWTTTQVETTLFKKYSE